MNDLIHPERMDELQKLAATIRTTNFGSREVPLWLSAEIDSLSAEWRLFHERQDGRQVLICEGTGADGFEELAREIIDAEDGMASFSIEARRRHFSVKLDAEVTIPGWSLQAYDLGGFYTLANHDEEFAVFLSPFEVREFLKEWKSESPLGRQDLVSDARVRFDEARAIEANQVFDLGRSELARRAWSRRNHPAGSARVTPIRGRLTAGEIVVSAETAAKIKTALDSLSESAAQLAEAFEAGDPKAFDIDGTDI